MVDGERPRLFDLRNGPAERYDRAADEPERVGRPYRRMARFAGEAGGRVAELPRGG